MEIFTLDKFLRNNRASYRKKNKQKNNQNIKEKCRRLYVVCGKFVVNMW